MAYQVALRWIAQSGASFTVEAFATLTLTLNLTL